MTETHAQFAELLVCSSPGRGKVGQGRVPLGEPLRLTMCNDGTLRDRGLGRTATDHDLTYPTT
jgi:hypothetical protein